LRTSRNPYKTQKKNSKKKVKKNTHPERKPFPTLVETSQLAFDNCHSLLATSQFICPKALTGKPFHDVLQPLDSCFYHPKAFVRTFLCGIDRPFGLFSKLCHSPLATSHFIHPKPLTVDPGKHGGLSLKESLVDKLVGP
jgi:hypothetical protein